MHILHHLGQKLGDMISLVDSVWGVAFAIQLLLGLYLIGPLLLYIANLLNRKRAAFQNTGCASADYAIIVTAYQETDQIPDVIDSILKSDYTNYLIYVVADNCDVSKLYFRDEKVMLLKPEDTLANNIKSHFYAINRFKRNHERVVIIDSDNLVDKDFFKELNVFFQKGHVAVQGVRRAKNLDTNFACLDEAGDMYYRYVDRKLLFETGSSASLAGSGMAFNTGLYKDCLARVESKGAGFDKILQYEILRRKLRIAFAEKAIVYDEKTAKSDQLVKQRARWINTWFKFSLLGVKLFFQSLKNFNYNQLVFGLMLCRPPLFILFSIAVIGVIFNLFIWPVMAVFWLLSIFSFVYLFFTSMRYFDAPAPVYRAVKMIPIFFFYQILALCNVKKANRLSVATQHTRKTTIDQLDHRFVVDKVRKE